MRYMCLVIISEAFAAAMQPSDWAVMGKQSQAYDQSLIDSGAYVHAEALQGSETARTVRVSSGEAVINNGPFAESKELIGGFILIDVADHDAAMEIAKNIPMARLGAIEVRPVMNF